MKRLLVSLLPLVLTHCLGNEGTPSSDIADSTKIDATRETRPDTSADTSADTLADSSTDTLADTLADTSVADIVSETIQPDVATPDATPSPDAARGETVAGLTVVARESATVAPQTVIHLRLANDPTIPAPARVEWSVVQPNNSVSLIVVTSATEATFEANVVGGYRFAALAFDADGHSTTLTLAMAVVPANGLHIELTWRTPGDQNEADTGGDQVYFSVGSDVDLHVLHPKASGAYFDWSYDCYWDNTIPEWGILGADDNPNLDRDDTDGGGPEITTLARYEVDATYTVGVHYWNDWGYGDAFATLRIYLDGVLQDEWGDVELRHDDLWDAFTIRNGVVTRVGATPSITPNYRGQGFQ